MVGVTGSAITNYEKGTSHPKEPLLYKLIEVLGVDANFLFQDNVPIPSESVELSPKHIDLLKKYRALDMYGQRAVEALIEIEYQRISAEKVQETQAATKETPSNIIQFVPYVLKPVSAGKGEYLLDDLCESEIAIKKTDLTERSDFAIGVTGDSMEPLYQDGDIVLVQAQQTVEIGEIGIFILNRESYIKKAGKRGLISLNPKYPEIIIKDLDDFRCVGKVVGKAEIVAD